MFITVNEITYDKNENVKTSSVNGSMPKTINVNEIESFRTYGTDKTTKFKNAGIDDVTQVVFNNGNLILIDELSSEFKKRLNEL